MEIAPNLHWLKLGSVNAYLCVDEDGLTLLDTGNPKQEGKILDYVRQIGRAPTDLKRILLTHADIDHAGSVAAVQQATSAQVYASNQSAALLPTGKGPSHNFWLMDIIGPIFMTYTPLDASKITVVQEGDTLPVLGGLNVLSTPGHTPDHISYFSPSNRIALIGDALAAWGDKLRPSPRIISADPDQVKTSAKKLLTLNPSIYACGHGSPIKADDPSVSALENDLATT